MRRREFITLVGGAAAVWPLAARAQQAAPVRLIGVLMGYAESDAAAQSWIAAFRGALAKLGWTEGSNLRIEPRWSAGDPDRIKTFAKELVDLRPDAILSTNTPPVGALARETKTIPIVFTLVADPIGNGFLIGRVNFKKISTDPKDPPKEVIIIAFIVHFNQMEQHFISALTLTHFKMQEHFSIVLRHS